MANTNGIIVFGQHMQRTIPEFYHLTMVQLSAHPLFPSAALSTATSAALFHQAFGDKASAADATATMHSLSTADKCIKGVIFLAILTIGSLIFVNGRLYSRWLSGQKFRFDDHSIVAALTICSLVQIVQILGCFVWHIGRHMWDITLDQYKMCLMVGWIVETTYYPILFFMKTSILYFYYHLLQASPFLKRACQITFVILVCGWAFFFINMFQCREIAFWRKPFERHCFDEQALLLSIGVFSIVTDFIMLAIPVSVIHKLQLRPREKLLLGLLFAMGTFGCIASVQRLFAVRKLAGSKDWTFHATQAAIFSIVEIHIGIMCACAVHLKALVYHVLPQTQKYFQQSVGTIIPWRTEKPRRQNRTDTSITEIMQTVDDRTMVDQEQDVELGKVKGEKTIELTTEVAIDENESWRRSGTTSTSIGHE